MKVQKRSGEVVRVSFDKVLRRIENLCDEEKLSNINIFDLAKMVINHIYDGVETKELDILAANLSSSMTTIHPDYGRLAASILISNHQKCVGINKKFSDITQELFDKKLVTEEYFNDVMINQDVLNKTIDLSKDYLFDAFGFKTLERSYLMSYKGKKIERPQDMWMRIAVAIHGKDVERVAESYKIFSNLEATHATPTLFNAGTRLGQLASCFLLSNVEDSIEGIFETTKRCAIISKMAGGIGVSMHEVRSSGSHIEGTNGRSSGLIPFLRVYNEVARSVDQAGKRKGAIAIYLHEWHADVEDFIQLRKPHGDESVRARDLFTALWLSDLFFERIKNDDIWSLFCPNDCPGLVDAFGDEFKSLYEKYELAGKARKTIRARELFFKIIDAQIESGTPYMLSKDAVNRKTNQKNLGTVRSSNLCAEITEFTSAEETAVCNLASISLPSCVIDGKFDFKKLHDIAKKLTYNLNKVIDKTYYPIPSAKFSNLKHRPIGLGVQGLADVYALLRMPFGSAEANDLNAQIFETMYHGSMEMSNELAIKQGMYESFKGSPLSEGKFQFDMWGKSASELSGTLDWETLRESVVKHGTRNSLLIALMPTASTSQILGNSECFEPITSNIYTRKTLSGEHVIVNKYLVNDLVKLGIWNTEIKDKLLMANGSVQNIPEIPDEIKELYKTVWEMDPIVIVKQAAKRGPFVCQSQSMNIYIDNPDRTSISRVMFAGWKLGLKTLSYYLRSKPASQMVKFTIDKKKNEEQECSMCSA